MFVAAVADDTPWHYALGGIWGLIAMIMATLAVLVAGHFLGNLKLQWPAMRNWPSGGVRIVVSEYQVW